MLTLVEITNNDITDWLFADDKADLLQQLHNADPNNDHIQAVIREVQ